MNKHVKLAILVVAYGALWGLFEATLGYALHLVHDYLPGIVMPAIGAAILVRFHRETGSRGAAVAVGAVAALVKAVDFLIPGMNPLRVANPMLSILIEALVMAALVPALSKGSDWRRVELQFSASLGWRVAFILALAIEYWGFGIWSGQLAGFDTLFEFVVFNGLASGAVWIFVDRLAARLPETATRPFAKPAFAAGMAALAVAATYFLS